MRIEVIQLSDSQKQEMGIVRWPVWEKEASDFDWYYDSVEECLLLEGEVTVTTADGASVCFGKGDFVRFPEGLSCHWHITKAVRKHYRFL